ncbi:bifunctional 3-phenylpropionate/cinnamic acid dioxygenase ferredoxin subunit [Nesterenkonia aerolata]|uniref:Bifunctional 3-phenylpropionate/cinnamic acid dioxygenase ferredoxin subunit n=1 Tax=Nesterenkonia aerolata TaxID=3074079 RepID=A0ABU2DSK3_9MICC|nr:bifunctional 3-phenylpropionate/cinnamic acid dioxygenase ferredoxin subunit [Nesterenkonia sp. LY-0111]MDR8019479.1 bifunctional 3-phenylpropionate/cinnamic acid dioxygenase ferredoxin subunit [Nesterenkonia sp. LY-0111]
MTFRACSLQDLTPGEGLRIDSVSPPIAVFLTEEGTVHAIDDTCTHQDASLAVGWVEDCRVECPLHESTFSLLTGEVDQPPAKRPVRVHQVSVDGDDVFVELSQDTPHLPPGVSLP